MAESTKYRSYSNVIILIYLLLSIALFIYRNITYNWNNKIIAIVTFIVMLSTAMAIRKLSDVFILLRKYTQNVASFLFVIISIELFTVIGISFLYSIIYLFLATILFSSYQRKNLTENYLWMGIIIGLVSLKYPVFSYMIVVIFLSLFFINTISIKNVCSLFFSVILVIWIALPIMFFVDNTIIIDYWNKVVKDFSTFPIIFSKAYINEHIKLLYLEVFIVAVNCVALVVNIFVYKQESVKVGNLFRVNGILSFIPPIITIFLPDKEIFLAISLIPITLNIARSIGRFKGLTQTIYIILIFSIISYPLYTGLI